MLNAGLGQSAPGANPDTCIPLFNLSEPWFLICKVKMTIPTLKGCCENWNNAYKASRHSHYSSFKQYNESKYSATECLHINYIILL